MTGVCNWDIIGTVRREVGDAVPVLANGGIENLDDAKRCMELTGTHGVHASNPCPR